jgi:hypothetical protein
MYSQGKWNKRGNVIFIDDTYRSVATVHVVKNYKDITFEPIVDVEAEANTDIICKAPQMYEAIKDVLDLFDGKGTANIEWIKARLADAVS